MDGEVEGFAETCKFNVLNCHGNICAAILKGATIIM